MIEKVYSKDLYEKLVKITLCAICIVDFDYKITSTSPRFVTLYAGNSSEENLIGTSILDKILDKGVFFEKLEEIKNNKNLIDFPTSFIRVNKETFNIEISGERLVDIDGNPLSILLYIRDNADIIRYKKQIEEKESRYRLLIENLSEGIWQIDENSNTTYVNGPMAKMLGYTVEEMIGKNLFYFMDEKGIEIAKLKVDERKKGIKEQHDFEFKHKDGQTIYVILETSPIIKDNKYCGSIAGVQNISERVNFEKTLKDSEEKFSRAFNTAPYAVSITQPEDGAFIDVNDAFVLMSGYSKKEILNSSSLALGLWAKKENRKEILNKLIQEVPVIDLEFLFIRKNGEVFAGLFSANFIQINNKEHIISSIRDLTDIKMAEMEKDKLTIQLQQAQKMEIIGRLAGGVAHNFNNLLTVIKGYTNLILSDAKENRTELIEIDKAASRATILTRQLLAFSRKQVLSPVKTNINELLQNLSKMLTTLMGENVTITYDLDKDIGSVLVDPAQLEQVIINLVNNSKDAMGSSGEIFIDTCNVKIGEEFISKHAEVIKGDYVMISVKDAGCGMTKDIMIHMWEPFFTTKDKGRGTGLGLPTVYGIIKQSNGYIFAESEVDKGSIFRIYLPLSKAKSILSKEEPDEIGLNLRGDETILVVEDEDIVRDFTKKLLEHNGYKILDAVSGEKAIEISKTYKDEISLLLTDVILPGLTGKETANEISKNKPDCKVIFVSGYTENTVIHQGILVDGVNFIQKPYSIINLLKKIRRVLDS